MALFISLQNVLPGIPGSPFSKPVDWQMNTGEIWTIIGPNGSGKTLLAETISGKHELAGGRIDYCFLNGLKGNTAASAKELINIISFNNVYSMADFRELYYQERFNNPYLEEIPLVHDLFHDNAGETDTIRTILETLDIYKLMDRRLIQLSSGELRKLIIARVMAEKPRLIIFDNPFIGLDIASRKHLNDIFPRMASNGNQLMFLVPSDSDMPLCTTHVMEMANCEILSVSEADNYKSFIPLVNNDTTPAIDWKGMPVVSDTDFNVAVQMDNIEIAYGKQVICRDINWKIMKGEKWALLGPNGSGKSTLLSYIFADNPRAYINGFTLFDRKRGSGESIWDIKRHIGFTSSEMHLYYRQNITCMGVIESGFFDSVGLYKDCYSELRRKASYFMELLRIDHLKTSLFLNVSTGEQRLTLFIRSIIKNPELLILDEPFQGLDDANKERCKQVVESFCSQHGKTLIFVTHCHEEIPLSVNRFYELM